MAEKSWNTGVPWSSPLLYQQSAPTHYHMHNFQHFEAGTNLCPRYPVPVREYAGRSSNLTGRQTSVLTQETEPEHESESDSEVCCTYSYLVKIINPKKKSDYVVRMWHGVSESFQHPTNVKEKLREAFRHDIPQAGDFQLGYLEGNTKRWIVEDKDLCAMYKTFGDGSKITLWCDGISHDTGDAGKTDESACKRRKTDNQSGPSLSDTTEDDEIFKKLKAKHPEMANPKLRLWAKLISKGRYDDYDTIPPIPFLQDDSTVTKKKKQNSLSDVLVDAATAIAKAFQTPRVVVDASPQKTGTSTGNSSKMSPMGYAQLRRSSLEDLKTLKGLYEENVISESEFVEEKDRILNTLKSLG